MHRRAHGGAWGAVVLIIGSCSTAAAEPPRTGGYSSGFSSAAPTSNVSTFVPSSNSTSSSAPAAWKSPTNSSSIDGIELTPVASSSTRNLPSIEIVPTPFVPSASALAQQGRVFSPASVVNMPHVPPQFTPHVPGSTGGAGWTAKDPTRAANTIAPAAAAPLDATPLGDRSPVVTRGPSDNSAPLVPVVLPEAQRLLLEKALRGEFTPVDGVASETISSSAAAPKSEMPGATMPDRERPISRPVAESNSESELGTARSAAKQAAPPTERPGDSADEVAVRKPKGVAAKTVEKDAEKAPAKVVEKTAVASQPKIVPLPPVELEVPSPAVPSPAAPTMNLPQPPIPLEYPRTGR